MSQRYPQAGCQDFAEVCEFGLMLFILHFSYLWFPYFYNQLMSFIRVIYIFVLVVKLFSPKLLWKYQKKINNFNNFHVKIGICKFTWNPSFFSQNSTWQVFFFDSLFYSIYWNHLNNLAWDFSSKSYLSVLDWHNFDQENIDWILQLFFIAKIPP